MSLLKKSQKYPKEYWIILAASIVLAIIIAVIIPIPRIYKWSVFFLVFSLLASAGILGWSIWKRNSSGNGQRNYGRRNSTRRGRR